MVGTGPARTTRADQIVYRRTGRPSLVAVSSETGWIAIHVRSRRRRPDRPRVRTDQSNPPMITVPLAGRIIGLKSRLAAYRAAARGDLPTIRMCGQLFVPTELVLQKLDVDPDPLTGRRRQRTKGGYKTKKAAEQALAEAIGQWPGPGSCTRGPMSRSGPGRWPPSVSRPSSCRQPR
jgi:hypothetical protein